MLFSKETPAAGGTAFAQFDAAWCYDGNGYIYNDTGTSLDVRIGASGSVQTLASGATLPLKLTWSMAELYVRRTDQGTTQVTVEATVGTGGGGGGSAPEMGAIAAAITDAHNADPAAHSELFAAVGLAPVSFYVDSVSGSDANAGTTPEGAVATLSKLSTLAIPNGATVWLRCGSVWNHGVDLSAKSRIVVRTYGAGPKPVIDSSAVLTGWAKTGGQTSVYEIAWATPSLGSSPCRVALWDAEEWMSPAASVAACDATPGTFYASGTVLYVHVSDSTSPAINGRAIRGPQNGVPGTLSVGHSSVVSGIEFRRPFNNNGSVEAAQNCRVEYCDFLFGNKHSLVQSGGILRSSTFERPANPEIYGDSSHVALYFNGSSDSASVDIEDCVFRGMNGWAQNAIVNHTDGGGVLRSLSVRRCAYYGSPSQLIGLVPMPAPATLIEDCYVEDGTLCSLNGNTVVALSTRRNTIVANVSTNTNPIIDVAKNNCSVESDGDSYTAMAASVSVPFVRVVGGISGFAVTVKGLRCKRKRGSVMTYGAIHLANGGMTGAVSVLASIFADDFPICLSDSSANALSYTGQSNTFDAGSFFRDANGTGYTTVVSFAAVSGETDYTVTPKHYRLTGTYDLGVLVHGARWEPWVNVPGVLTTDAMSATLSQSEDGLCVAFVKSTGADGWVKVGLVNAGTADTAAVTGATLTVDVTRFL